MIKQGCARDLLSQDRDETRDPCLQDRDETEKFKILSETRPRRDVAASETLAETLKLPSLGSFTVSPRRFLWSMVKHIANEKKLYELIKSHHGKHFLFVILWDFALSIVLTAATVCTRPPAQNVSTRLNGPRPETRLTGPRPRHIAPKPRRDRNVEDFVRDETQTRR